MVPLKLVSLFKVTYLWHENKFNLECTSCISLTLQSIIGHALEDETFAVMGTRDLSAAFDMVNV